MKFFVVLLIFSSFILRNLYQSSLVEMLAAKFKFYVVLQLAAFMDRIPEIKSRLVKQSNYLFVFGRLIPLYF